MEKAEQLARLTRGRAVSSSVCADVPGVSAKFKSEEDSRRKHEKVVKEHLHDSAV